MNSWSERATFVENVFVDEGDPKLHDAKSIFRAAMKTSVLVINKGNILLWLLPAVLPICEGDLYERKRLTVDKWLQAGILNHAAIPNS